MDENTCNSIYNLVGGTCVGLLLIISEALPFINAVKSNGLIEIIITFFIKKNKSGNIEEDIINGDGSVYLLEDD